MALVLAPEAPVSDWLTEFDGLVARSPGFFVGRPVVLDVSALPQEEDEIVSLAGELRRRNVRLIGMEGADPAVSGAAELPPSLTGGRGGGVIDMPEGQGGEPEKQAAQALPRKEGTTLYVERHLRSGQSIYHPEGDVVVMGSVASGAEVAAGGSIHVYGALRGRAMAGWGSPSARIFCRSFEAELVAIDGLYMMADDMDQSLRRRPVQARLDGDTMVLTAMDEGSSRGEQGQ